MSWDKKSIRLVNVHHTYAPKKGGEKVLSDISQTFEEGKAYALLGPSGCGKTTLLNILSGLLAPTEGKVFIGDLEVTKLPPQERNIAQIFQFPVVYESMSVYDNLAFPLRARKYSKEVIDETVTRTADLLELTSDLHHRAGELGVQSKQIIALGRGLVREEVNAILLDEALTAVDPYEKWIFRRKLKEIHRQYSHVMIYVTHDQSEALTFADHVMVMNHGKILQTDTPERLFEYPQYKFVGYFIGSPGMNFLPASVKNGEVVLCNQLLTKISEAVVQQKLPSDVKKWEVGVRPEYIRLTQNKQDSSDTLFSVQLQNVTSLGSLKIVKVLLEGHELLVKVPESFVGGESLYASFPKDKIRLYADDRLVAEVL